MRAKYKQTNGRPEHLTIAEQALGHSLPEGAEVHHVNKNGLDNRPSNLVICENRSYHRLLHQRENALHACGHADWRKCKFCKGYSPVEQLVMGITRRNGYEPAPYHQKCQTEYRAAWRRARGIPAHPWKNKYKKKENAA